MIVAILGELIGLLAVVLLFGIPLSWSPVGRALAEYIRNQSNPGVETFQDLETRLKALEAELHQIREALVLGEDRPALGSARLRTLGSPDQSERHGLAGEKARQPDSEGH